MNKSVVQAVLGILGGLADNPTALLSIVSSLAGGPMGPVISLAITYGVPVVFNAVKVLTTPTITEDDIKAQIARMVKVEKIDLKSVWD